MRFRSMVESDLDQVLSVSVTHPIRWATPEQVRANLADHSYRHDRIWLAVDDDGNLLARAVWWGFPTGEHPLTLDCVWVHESVDDAADLAVRLLTAAHQAFTARGVPEIPECHMFLPPRWEDDPAITALVAWRRDVLGRVGLTDELRRHQYAWTPESGVPDPTGRLEFRPEPDDEVFAEAFAQVAVDTLDVTTRRELERMDPLTQAREDVAMYRQMNGERDWWRLAVTPDGELAGLALPSANAAGPVVGYLGVLPKFRGRGYVDDLLGEITRVLAADGADQIRADTDYTNLPMAAAFDRAGYRVRGTRLVLSTATSL